MKKKVFIMYAQYGNKLEMPVFKKTRKEAEKAADEYIINVARQAYIKSGGNPNDDVPAIKKWAAKNKYEFRRRYFSSSKEDTAETVVDEQIIIL